MNKKKKPNNQKTWKQYVVMENGTFYDLLSEEWGSMLYGSSEQKDFFIKNKKLYCKSSYEVCDDWYADIGAITHWENNTSCLGKIKCASNNIDTIINNCYLNQTTLIFENNVKYKIEGKIDKKQARKIVGFEVKEENNDNIIVFKKQITNFNNHPIWYIETTN